MAQRAAEMQLSIDVGSDPISGSVSVDGNETQQFSGWIELVATIESAREVESARDRDSSADKTLGSFPGANGSRM